MAVRHRLGGGGAADDSPRILFSSDGCPRMTFVFFAAAEC